MESLAITEVLVSRTFEHSLMLLWLTHMTGQFGRGLGPLIFCSLYWWAGRETAYATGAIGMTAVCFLVFGLLKVPPGTQTAAKSKTT